MSGEKHCEVRFREEEKRRREAEKRHREELARRQREEQRRLAEEQCSREKEAERQRIAEEKRRREEEERQRIAEEQEAERQRVAEEKRIAEEKRAGVLKAASDEEDAKTQKYLKEIAAKYQPASSYEKPTAVKKQTPPTAPEVELIADCRRFFVRIQNLNSSAAAEYDSLLKEVEAGTDTKRLHHILDDLQLSYGRELTLAARTACLRQELTEMLTACEAGIHPENFQARLRTLLSKAQLTEEDILDAKREFEDFADKMARQAVLENLAVAAGNILTEMGYQVMDAEGLTLDRTHCLATSDPDYRVQFRLNSQSGRVAFKHVRVAASDEEAAAPLSDSQKALALQSEESWCEDFGRMLERLNNAGSPIEVVFRREAGQGDFPVVVDERLPRRRRPSKAVAKISEQKLT